jgi:hypothetical protein
MVVLESCWQALVQNEGVFEQCLGALVQCLVVFGPFGRATLKCLVVLRKCLVVSAFALLLPEKRQLVVRM